MCNVIISDLFERFFFLFSLVKKKLVGQIFDCRSVKNLNDIQKKKAAGVCIFAFLMYS